MALLDLITRGAKELFDKFVETKNRSSSSSSSSRDGRGSSGGSGNSAVDYYLRELGRAQRAWYEYTDPKLKQGAHEYANKLRAEAASKGIDLTKYGIKTPYGLDYRHYYTEPGLAGKYHDRDNKMPDWLGTSMNDNFQQATGVRLGGSGGGGGAFGGMGTPSGQMYNQFQALMMGMNNPNSEYFQMLQEQAMRQAQEIARQRQMALQELIDNLKAQQESGMMSIQSNLKDAQQNVEDKAFQAWLAARQQMANRGLAGSGIASDQDTRLLLQKQRDLAGIFRDAARQQFELENRIGSQLENAYRQLADINPDQIGADLFFKLYQEGRQGLMDQAKLYSQMLSELLPYDMATMKDLLDYQLGSQRNNLSAMELALKAIEGNRNFSLELSRATGYLYGADGKPVLINGRMVPLLDREKLEEAIRHNKATEELAGKRLVAQMQKWANDAALASRRLELSEAEFYHKMDMDQAEIDMAKDKLKHEKDKTLVSNLQAQLRGIDSQISAWIRSNPGSPIPQELARQRDAIIRQISNVFTEDAVYEDVEDYVTRHSKK